MQSTSSTTTTSGSSINQESDGNLNYNEDVMLSKRRKDLFGDCALIEIIHLHDCLRGALKALERDVNKLSQTVLKGERNQELSELERIVAGRFQVIWSVFRAHSSAEDEFIWPTLQSKTQGSVKGSPKYKPDHAHSKPSADGYLPTTDPSDREPYDQSQFEQSCRSEKDSSHAEDATIEQEEYEEDHADEERMFSKMDDLLTKLRRSLVQQHQQIVSAAVQVKEDPETSSDPVADIMRSLHDLTKTLSKHLMAHLEKEEKQCMPLVVKHLSKTEIHDLVGKIMGKRSSDMIAQIMSMAVQNLNEADREEMVKYMKQAMAGTFFDRWLSMSGWMNDSTSTKESSHSMSNDVVSKKRTAVAPNVVTSVEETLTKRLRPEGPCHDTSANILSQSCTPAGEITSPAELERLIRAIASNQNLTSTQKNMTIQGLRDSVWKSNQRLKQKSQTDLAAHSAGGNNTIQVSRSFPGHVSTSSDVTSAAVSATCTPARRVTPPAVYFKKNSDGKLEIVWTSDGPASRCPDDGSVPLFSAAELAPTYHDGATGAVLGCPHYARACKLRHPKSGRLYTCRLCCEQEREMPMKDQDEPLDRYAVTEVMCMKCNALQPAEDRCVNPHCQSQGRPYAKYFCRICHLYDDRQRPIFHCPYCNTCRMGLGLGIDFRHCMRCNACVSLEDNEHRCIPQKLQGSCPICHESLFQSTEPLRGLKCGHVMHLSCFTQYRRGQSYTCPLCMRSMEDMTDYFALLDAAVRMQPMPSAYLSTISNIYCQDCAKTGQCHYHFVGQKCPHCGSYNTREMGRVLLTQGPS